MCSTALHIKQAHSCDSDTVGLVENHFALTDHICTSWTPIMILTDMNHYRKIKSCITTNQILVCFNEFETNMHMEKKSGIK